jgi:periplasmic protein TonB
MFEDSTFESTGRIRTRSRSWMMAAFLFNGSILLALVLIPLIYPEALPRQLMSILIEAPRVPPVQAEKPKPVAVKATRDLSELENGKILAPPMIPPKIRYIATAEPPIGDNLVGVPDLGQGGSAVPGEIFQGHTQPPVVHAPAGPVSVTSTIAEGLLLQKAVPVYPVIAKATRTEGVVVLQATISRSGAIEKLHVISGHPILQKAAIDAVTSWRYRPYLLNGQPVEVETTVNVIFRLSQ